VNQSSCARFSRKAAATTCKKCKNKIKKKSFAKNSKNGPEKPTQFSTLRMQATSPAKTQTTTTTAKEIRHGSKKTGLDAYQLCYS